MKKTASISIIGSGKVAKSLVQGYLHAGFPKSSLTVYARSTSAKLSWFQGVVNVETSYETLGEVQCIILAVTPGGAQSVLKDIQLSLPKRRVPVFSFVSTLTVTTIKRLLRIDGKLVVRGMLNTNIDTGNGLFIFGLVGHENEKKLMSLTQELFGKLGVIEYVRGAPLLDKAIAGVGSMNAYALTQLYASASGLQAIGYSEKDAVRMALLTMQSAVSAMLASGDTTLQSLLDRIATVTTKGGCTEEQVAHLLDVFLKEFDVAMRKTHKKAMTFKKFANK